MASGGFGDVWEGVYDDKPVAIKALRVYKPADVKKVAKASFPNFVKSSGGSN